METQFENIETTTVKSEDILDAAMALHVKYPAERVAIWVELGEKEQNIVCYTAVVQTKEGANFRCYSNESTPFEAVKNLIAKAGNRDPNRERLEKINKLREELRKLEEEGRVV